MRTKIRAVPAWMLLVALAGCQGEGSADEYLKISDMEPDDTDGDSGCNIEWSSSTYSGSQRGYIQSDVSPTFAELDSPYTTMRGVVSQHAARLWTVQPLDTTPADDPSNSGQADGGAQADRLWGANLILRPPQTSAPQCPLPLIDNSPDGGSRPRQMDLSAYSGLVFWAKAAGATYASPLDAGQASHTMAHRIRVLVRDQYSDPSEGICTESSDIKDTATKCWNAFSATLDLTESFARYEVDFSTMWRDPTWGATPHPYAPDLQHVYSIAFEVGAAKCVADQNATCVQESPPLAFDFWIDDLYLVKHGR
jgi:hypothetical protein